MVPVVSTPSQTLFVYGSLLSKYVPKGANPIVPPPTLRTAKFVGPATLRGYRLCDLGRYPCIVPVRPCNNNMNINNDKEEECVVYGELYELNLSGDEECWKVLDAYEGISQQYEEPYEYRRQTVTVELNDGGERTRAETYVYNLDDGDKLERIEDGDYIAYYNAKHADKS